MDLFLVYSPIELDVVRGLVLEESQALGRQGVAELKRALDLAEAVALLREQLGGTREGLDEAS